MKEKALSLILMLMTVTMLTGCVDYEIGIRYNKDNTGYLSLTTVVPEEFTETEVMTKGPELGDYEDGIISHTESIYRAFKDEEGTELVEIGNKIHFKDANRALKEIMEEGGDGAEIIITDVDSKHKKIEFIFEDELHETLEDQMESDQDIWGASTSLKDLGAKVRYVFETDGNIVDTNGKKESNGRVVWDLLEDTNEVPKYVTFEVNEQQAEKAQETKAQANVKAGVQSTRQNKFNHDTADRIDGYEMNLVEDRTSPDMHGNILRELVILYGNDQGDLELDRKLKRVEGAAVYARVLFTQDEIENFDKNYDSGFTDIPTWAKQSINILHSNGLISGISETKFGSDNPMTADQYSTLMLRALGLDDKAAEFKWDEAFQYIVDNGGFEPDLVDYKTVITPELTRRGLSYITHNMLFIETTRLENNTLIRELNAKREIERQEHLRKIQENKD